MSDSVFRAEDHPNFERQIALEAEMVSRGNDIFRRTVTEARGNHLESTTSHGSYLVKKAIKPIADAIRDFLKEVNTGAPGRKHVAAQYLQQVSPDTAAFIALRVALNTLSTRITLQNAAITIANAIEGEVRLAAFEAANVDEYKKATQAVGHSNSEQYKRAVYSYIANRNDVNLPSWPRRDKVLLGHKLLEIIVDVTGYIEIITDYKSTSAKRSNTNGAYTYHVIGSQRCLDWIAKMEDYTELAVPEFMPTIMPPKPWTSPYSGGYYSMYKPLRLVKTGTPEYMEELSMLADEMPVLYEAINAMQGTGYVINRNVLETMTRLWESGGDVAGIPARENYKLPRCPFCGEEIAYGYTRGKEASPPPAAKLANNRPYLGGAFRGVVGVRVGQGHGDRRFQVVRSVIACHIGASATRSGQAIGGGGVDVGGGGGYGDLSHDVPLA